MISCAIVCHVMVCCAIISCVIMCFAIMCHVTMCCAIISYVMLGNAMVGCAMVGQPISAQAQRWHGVSWYAGGGTFRMLQPCAPGTFQLRECNFATAAFGPDLG